MKKNFLSIALLIGALQIAPIEAGREKKDRKESDSKSSRPRRTLATHTGVEEPTEEPMGSGDHDYDETTALRKREPRHGGAWIRPGAAGGPERTQGRIHGGPEPVDPRRWVQAIPRDKHEQITLEEVAKRDIILLKEFSDVPCLKHIIKGIEEKVQIFEEQSKSKRLAPRRKSGDNSEFTEREQKVIRLMRMLERVSSDEMLRFLNGEEDDRGDDRFREGISPVSVDRVPTKRRLSLVPPTVPYQEIEEQELRRQKAKTTEITRTAKELPKKAVKEELRRKVTAPAPVKK